MSDKQLNLTDMLSCVFSPPATLPESKSDDKQNELADDADWGEFDQYEDPSDV